MTEKKTYIVRWVAVVVAVVSILVNVYLFMLKEKEKSISETLGGQIYDLTTKLLQTEQRVAMYEQQDKVYQDSIQALNERNKASILREQNALIQLHYHQKTISNLKKQLDEKVTIIDIPDDDQLELFFKWANIKE